MPIYGKGPCHYGLEDECILGDKGIEVDPVYCQVCAILKLAKAVAMLKEESPFGN